MSAFHGRLNVIMKGQACWLDSYEGNSTDSILILELPMIKTLRKETDVYFEFPNLLFSVVISQSRRRHFVFREIFLSVGMDRIRGKEVGFSYLDSAGSHRSYKSHIASLTLP